MFSELMHDDNSPSDTSAPPPAPPLNVSAALAAPLRFPERKEEGVTETPTTKKQKPAEKKNGVSAEELQQHIKNREVQTKRKEILDGLKEGALFKKEKDRSNTLIEAAKKILEEKEDKSNQPDPQLLALEKEKAAFQAALTNLEDGHTNLTFAQQALRTDRVVSEKAWIKEQQETLDSALKASFHNLFI